MNILIACLPIPLNKFLINLEDTLIKLGHNVIHNHEFFWKKTGDFDIVNIKFPEHLSYEIESHVFENKEIDEDIFIKLTDCLEYWKVKSKIVVTRHNTSTVYYSNLLTLNRLYEIIFSYAYGVKHLGNYSIVEYFECYKNKPFLKDQIHEVIHHHNYNFLPNQSSYVLAREKLKIRKNSKVVLVLGAFRSQKETNMVLEAFKKLPFINKTLLIPWFKDKTPNLPLRFKYRLKYFKRFLLRFHPWFHFGYEFVPDEEIHYYLNAANVVLIQRFNNELNSGNVILGYSFGKVVVGPKTGNIGELLQETCNPVFDPSDMKSIVQAIKKGITLSKTTLGTQNKAYSDINWNVIKIAKKQIAFYQKLCMLSSAENSLN